VTASQPAAAKVTKQVGRATPVRKTGGHRKPEDTLAFINELGALIDMRLTDENREEVAGALDREAYRLDGAARSKLSRDDRPFANELAALVDRYVVDESFDKLVLALDVESSRLDRAGPLVPRSDWRRPDYARLKDAG
jgi:hypothetical protein